MPRLDQEHTQITLPFLVTVGLQSVLSRELCVFQSDNFRESSGLQFLKDVRMHPLWPTLATNVYRHKVRKKMS